MVKLGGGWDEALSSLFTSENYLSIRNFLKKEYENHTIYPDMFDIFNCFRYTSLSEVKAVILGQDPYHGENQAHGLCFSVKHGVKAPPSLVNIFKELKSDLNITAQHGNLTNWAKSGVVLLNTSLTVRASQPNSHSRCGWQKFTDGVILAISKYAPPSAFILWGANARSKNILIDKNKHFIIESVHPSPLSAFGGFFGSKPFSKTNEFLASVGREPVDWNI